MGSIVRRLPFWCVAVWLSAATAWADTGIGAAARVQPGSEPVVRISQGFFAPSLLEQVRDALQASRPSLDPALRALPGLLHYYVAVDAVSSSIVNVSVWVSPEAAAQMNDLAAMRAQRDVFVKLGVEFQPVRSYTGLWSIAP